MEKDILSTGWQTSYWNYYNNKARINPRFYRTISLVVIDFLSILLSCVVSMAGRFLLDGRLIPYSYRNILYLLPMAILIYFLAGLYKENINAVEELRRISQATLIFFLCMVGIFFLLKESDDFSRLFWICAWVLSTVTVPFGREVIRSIEVKLKIWGEPVIIFGNGKLGNEVANFLIKNPKMGYIPIAIVDRRKNDRETPGNKIIHDQEIAENRKTRPGCFNGIRTAFVVIPEISQSIQNRLIDEQTLQFEHLILVSSSNVTSSLCVQPLDIGGILGLEVGHNLLNKGQMVSKRAMDLFLVILSLPLLIPLFGFIALLIKMDSKGPVFYHQKRIGFGGKEFKMWKFRSMHQNAETLLSKYLEENEDLRAEWEAQHKLKNDPRITRIGKFLRKYSLDEIPQLINVFIGEMGLVGPRPIVNKEILFYNKRFELYTHVIPGMTGMWQISGRSDTSYDKRVGLDEYYVRNWSIWLDLYIFLHTFAVVIQSKGSY